jgi:hypothetical protein
MGKGRLISVLFMALAVLVIAGVAAAADKGNGSMSGGMEKGSMSGMHGEGKMEGHGMMKMGDKVFDGTVGPWHGEARLMDMKAQMEKAKASGMKMQGMEMMKNTHHLSLMLTDPQTKKAVTEGLGSVTVTGPDHKEAKTTFMAMQGHFGADVNLPTPGKYEFYVEIEAGGKKGSAKFAQEIK